MWKEAVEALTIAAPSFPQSAYAGAQKSLQREWQFVQRVRSDIARHFEGVKNALNKVFIPALFGEPIDDDDPRLQLAVLPVKKAGLAIPDPVASADTNYKASTLVCGHLSQAICGKLEFSSADHSDIMREVRSELKDRNKAKHEKDLKSIVNKMPCDTRRNILRGTRTGQWLSVLPSVENGTELSAQEWRDSLHLRYARSPPDLPTHCDGCLKKFSVRHALECKKGGLVILRHNEIQDELCDLASRAFTPSSVRDKPKIHLSRDKEEAKATETEETAVSRNLRKSLGEERGDVLIQSLWDRGTDCIIDVRITDTDSKSQLSKDPLKVLAAHEREKKKKYLEACLDQRRHFTPFVVSTDGLIGKEATALLKKLSSLIAEKSGKPYSEVCGYVNARMSIAIVRATHLCLRGSRIPTGQMSNRRLESEDGAGMGLL